MSGVLWKSPVPGALSKPHVHTDCDSMKLASLYNCIASLIVREEKAALFGNKYALNNSFFDRPGIPRQRIVIPMANFAGSQTAYLVLEYLQELKENQQELVVDKEKFASGLNLIQDSLIDLSENDGEYRYALKPHSLCSLIKAGAETTGAQTQEQEEKECEKNPLFQKFLGAVTAKGFFKGTSPGEDEYKIRYRKMVLRFKDKMKQSAPKEDEESENNVLANSEEEAECLKEEGNTLLKNKDFEGACEAYTKAIQMSPNGAKAHIYFANRAAARQYLKQHRGALDDCEAALARDPLYSKAHSRLAATHAALGDWHSSVQSYERCLELDPANAAAQTGLANSRAKAKKTASSSNQMAGMPPMGAGGMPGGFGAMMQNPAMMQMAQNMMSNPAMMQQAQSMMSNPAMMQAAMGAMGGGMSEEDMAEAMEAMNNNKI